MSHDEASYHFILNPVAGRGKAYHAIKNIRMILRNLTINHRISITDAPFHATEIARESIKTDDILIAVGGDGTINEVVNGIVNTNKIFGILPLGSGNDFAKATNIPINVHKAIKIILNNKRKSIDIGKVKTTVISNRESILTTERFFINGVGIGFDARVAFESSKIKALRGLPLYMTSVFKSLFSYEVPLFSVRFDSETLKGPFFLIAVGNGTSAGGGFLLTPNAKLDDRIFDICYVKNLNILEIIKIFPTVFKGKHNKFDKVHFRQSSEIHVNSMQNFYVHADGEIVGKNVNNVDISLVPETLEVIVG
jgi:diacylglycerol kinase (ATP)